MIDSRTFVSRFVKRAVPVTPDTCQLMTKRCRPAAGTTSHVAYSDATAPAGGGGVMYRRVIVSSYGAATVPSMNSPSATRSPDELIVNVPSNAISTGPPEHSTLSAISGSATHEV